MAPIKNSHTSYNNHNTSNNYTPNSSANNNTSSHQNRAGATTHSVSSTTHRKHTGTVSKATAPVVCDASQEAKTSVNVNASPSEKAIKSAAKRSSTFLLQQTQQQQQPPPFVNECSSPFSILTAAQSQQHHHQSAQQQLQQQQSQQQLQQQQLLQPQEQSQQQLQQQQQQQLLLQPQQQHIHQRKNTEVVAPIRRELKDLNDYILSAVVTTTNNNSKNQRFHQQHQNKKYNYSKPHQQLQVHESNSLNSGIEIDTILDNQSRIFYPVRPIPRRNLQQLNDTATNDFGNGSSCYPAAATTTTTTNLNLLNHPAAIGVVIPTTPGIANNSGAGGGSSNSNSYNSYSLAASNEEDLVNVNNFAETITSANKRGYSNNINNINNNSNIISNNSTFTINQQQLLLLQQLQQQIEEQSSHLLAVTHSPQQQKLQKQQHQQLESATSTITSNLLDLDGAGVLANSSSVETGTATDTDINLLQRLQLIQQLLALNAKPNPVAAAPGSSQLTDINRHPNMVNEVRSPTVTERDVIVNSSSLEDVVTSEINDNRAQSIQSLHSALEETPTPTDNGPSYAELQLRLELSNRNIQNMQEQQKQLLRLQQQAKLHLNEMETIRQGAPLTCGQQNGNDSNNPPDYQSIQQVHSDMSSLVGRMKNLTTFIQHQNELGNLLGDDGPDILAEQEALQRKLQSLRMQRDEMRNLVGELQDIHRDAELTVEKRKQDNEQHRQQSPQQQLQQSLRQDNNVITDVADASLSSNERIVPIEYSRIVPTELVPPKGRVVSLVDAEDSAAAEMIRQKVADIAAMKAQLSRLKNMMETVNLIEEHTARTEPTDVGRVSAVASAIDIPVQRERSLGGYERDRSDSYDRERTPTAGVMNDQENELISAKVRILNEVTSDLRAQALSLQAERDRIKALKDEIVRRKAEAAAAAQMGEDALKSHSLTPTPQIQRRVAEEQAERELIKEEYAVKKKGFEELCQHLGQNEGCNASTPSKTLHQNQANGIRDLVSEADDEAEPEEEPTDSDFGVTSAVTTKYYPAQASNSIEISAKRVVKNTSAMNVTNQRGGKRSTEESTAPANVADIPNETAGSMEAASIKSGSSQSLSMPPPMHPMNGTNLTSNWLPGPIPPPLPAPWNPQYYYGSSSAQPSATSFTPPQCIASMNQHHQHHPSISNNVECICNASLNASTLGAPVNTTNSGDTSGATNASVSFNTDPMMFQQFVQTQQMLINSVCQCNQMLWHQQREIDALNNAIHVLQNRLLSLGGPPTADLGFDIRAESVPPPNSLHTGSQHSNNLYAAMQTRSHSEQPAAAFLPLTCSVGCANYQQQHQIHHQHVFQRRQQQRSALGYNYGNEMQQNANTSTSIYTALNNAAPAAPPPPPPQFNNEAPPQSPSIASAAGGPGPIFMHHHNNAIHQNNANLRTQNHHANNLLQQQQQQHSNIAVNASNTLNNQVPPGNRANNYWDNFRSYSRQNLLSTNSNKSNEDQNQQQMQQHELDQQYQPPPAHHLPIPAMQQQQPQQQQLQPPSQSLYQQREINQNNNGSPTDCNNLNYESNNTTSNTNNISCNKYMRSLQRNRINQLQQQQHVGSMLLSSDANNVFQANAPAAARELLENLNWHSNTTSANVVDEDNDLFELYNIAYINDMSTTYAGSAAPGANARNMNNMNMNVNFGNNMQNQRNKVPAKPTCRSATSLHRANMQMAAAAQRDQQQHYVNAAETQSYDLLTNRTASEQQPPHSLSAPPSTQSLISTPVAALTTRNPEDFALCPVDVADGFKSVATATDDPDFIPDSVAAHTEKEADDTTSEEIKRNLLVNALKNDKFTTKFYESIKEDVFRHLESLLLEKETTERPGGLAEQTSLQQQQPHYLAQSVNDVGGGATRDPTHKLYLNAQMGSRQQQHPAPSLQQSKVEISASADRAELDGRNIAEETESNNADDNDLSETSEAISAGVIESVCNVVAVGNLEDEEPEENGNQGHKHNRPSAAVFSLSTSQASATTINKSTIRNAAIVHPIGTRLPILGELKNHRQQPQTANGTFIGHAITGEAQPALFTIITNQDNNIETKNLEYRTPDFELLNYIITRIQNQTKPDTLVDDAVLVEVAKLTAKAAQNSNATKLADAAKAAAAGGGDNSLASIHQQQALNISPKKIYSKIKKLSNVPRQRDQFLKWYHSYMETLLYVCNNNNDNNNNNSNNYNIKCSVRDKKYKHNQQNVAIRNKQPPGLDNFNNINSQRKLQNGTGIIAPYTNSGSSSCSISSTASSDNNIANNISITNADNLSVNDADLAEADQICSPNTSVSNQDDEVAGFVVVNNIAVKIEQHVSFEANHTPQIKEENRVDELENNENPEEECAAAGAICNALLLESNDKTKQNGLKQEEDKLNMTDIKIEPNITESQQSNDLNKSGLEVQDSNIDHSNGNSDAAETTTKYSVVRPSISTSTTITTTKKDLMKHMNRNGVA